MHQVKTKAGTFGGITITAIGPAEALSKAHELIDVEGLTDIVIVDPKGDTYDLATFEKRVAASQGEQ